MSEITKNTWSVQCDWVRTAALSRNPRFLHTTSVLKQREVPATVSSFCVSVLYSAMLRTSIAAAVLGCFYFCPVDCDASVMVVDCAAVETGCMLEKYIPRKGCNKYVFIFIFWSRCCCCCCCVLLLLPTTSVLKRREVPATVSSFSVSATSTAVSFGSILLLLLRLRRDACREKQTKKVTFLFLWWLALLLLFTHRRRCAEENKIGFCFLFDTGTKSIAFSVTGCVLLLFLSAPGFCSQHQY